MSLCRKPGAAIVPRCEPIAFCSSRATEVGRFLRLGTDSSRARGYAFWPNADADQAGRNTLQYTEASQHANVERRIKLSDSPQHARDDSLLNNDLESLRDPRGQLAPALHGFKTIDIKCSLAQSFRNIVCGRHGVLDREINPDPADRRHGVRGITDLRSNLARFLVRQLQKLRE